MASWNSSSLNPRSSASSRGSTGPSSWSSSPARFQLSSPSRIRATAQRSLRLEVSQRAHRSPRRSRPSTPPHLLSPSRQNRLAHPIFPLMPMCCAVYKTSGRPRTAPMRRTPLVDSATERNDQAMRRGTWIDGERTCTAGVRGQHGQVRAPTPTREHQGAQGTCERERDHAPSRRHRHSTP